MFELLAHADSSIIVECYNSLGTSRIKWEIKIVSALCLPLMYSVLMKGKWIPNELTQLEHSYVQIMFADRINDANDQCAFLHSFFQIFLPFFCFVVIFFHSFALHAICVRAARSESDLSAKLEANITSRIYTYCLVPAISSTIHKFVHHRHNLINK